MTSNGVQTCNDGLQLGGIATKLHGHVLRPLLVLLVLVFTVAGVAKANAETRTLRMYYTHTKESITVTFKKNGRYSQRGLKKLNRFLRDFRRNEPTRMDPELFDVVWEIYKASGSRKPIHVISGYRSPRTNNMLRRRGRKVARNSQHTRGKALDFFLPDVSVNKLRALGLKAHAGGVGFYRGSFVHIDTGRVRHWPRMSRRQLSRVFPRGRTIHVPSDGRKLKGYKIAAANLRKGLNYNGSKRLTGAKPSLLARIFKSSGDDGDENEGNTRRVAKAKKPAKKPKAVAKSKPKPAPKKPAPKKPSGPDPFAIEVAAVSKQKKLEAEAAAIAAKKEEERAAEQATTQLARVVVPTRRPRIAVPQVEPEENPQADVLETVSRTELALATPKQDVPIVRPEIDVATRTGNTVAAADENELDALKSRIKTALARQRQLSAAEQATARLTQTPSKLAVPTPKKTPASAKPVLQAALQPEPQPTTKPSWRKKEPQSAAVDLAGVQASVPTPKAETQAAKTPAVTAKAKPETQKPAVSKPDVIAVPKASMIGELALGNLDGEQVKEWAIAVSTRVGPIAALHAPVYDQGTRRLMPGSVYSAGFANDRAPLRADRFSGRALTRVAFAKVALN